MTTNQTPRKHINNVLIQINRLSQDYQQGGDIGALSDLEKVGKHLLRVLLSQAFKPDQRAAESVRRVLSYGIHDFEILSKKNPGIFAESATTHPSWPGLVSVDRDVIAENKSMTDGLRLGTKTKLKFGGRKQWSRKTPEVYVALKLWGLVENFRIHRDAKGACPKSFDRAGKLQPLNRKNYVSWWQAAEPLFISLYGEKFEDHTRFAHHWKSATYKDNPKPRALIKSAIKKQIKQAFRSIANPVE